MNQTVKTFKTVGAVTHTHTHTITFDERKKDIDILKGIGILFVILGHMQELIPVNLLIYIYSFHMPLFFYISGFLYKEKYEEMTFYEYIKKRAKELVYPYITLSIINFLWCIVKQHSIIATMKYILSFIYSNYIFETNYVGAVWFLLCLFIVEVMYFILKKNKQTKTVNITIIICGILGIAFSEVIKIKYFRLPFWIDIALFGIVFYHVGNLVSNADIRIDKKLNKILILIICIIISIIGIVLNYNYCYTEKFLGRIDMLYLHFGNYIYFYIAAFAGIITWQITSNMISKNKTLELLGQNTLIIMGVHIIILQVIVKLFSLIQKVFNIAINSYLEITIVLLIVASSSVWCSIFIKKYMPRFCKL